MGGAAAGAIPMPITLSLWVDDREVAAVGPRSGASTGASISIGRTSAARPREFRVRLTAGEHRIAVAIPRIFEGLPARFNGPNPSARPEPPREFTPPPDTPARAARAC